MNGKLVPGLFASACLQHGMLNQQAHAAAIGATMPAESWQRYTTSVREAANV